jgi:hypothetical protein
VLEIKSSGADIIGSYITFDNDLAIFARQLRQVGVTLPWVGSPGIVDAGVVKLAGPAVWGTYGIVITPSIRARRRRNSPSSTAPSRTRRLTFTVHGPMTRSACFQSQSTRLDRPTLTRSAPPYSQPEATRRGGRIQLRRVRRRLARLQYRTQRKGRHRLRQAHRIHGLTDDERIRDAISAVSNQGDEMTFGDRRLDVNSSRLLRMQTRSCCACSQPWPRDTAP